MNIVYPLTPEWVDLIEEWSQEPDIQAYMTGGMTYEEILRKCGDGTYIAIGLSDGEWKGLALLEPKGTQAELLLMAPGKRKEAIEVISRISEFVGFTAISGKFRANRFKKWEDYSKKQWQRIVGIEGWEYRGMLGQGDHWYILGIKELNHG